MGKFKDVDTALKQGGICLLPTETVYGLGVDPFNSDSVDRLYALKGRDFDKPLALCVKNIKQAERFGKFNILAYRLAKKLWPGPLTLILNAQDGLELDPRLFGTSRTGERTIALRCPDISWIKKLDNLPIALTSANKSGDPDPLSFREAFYTMGAHTQAVIEGPIKSYGLPSTIVAISGEQAEILRRGPLTADDFAEFNIEWAT